MSYPATVAEWFVRGVQTSGPEPDVWMLHRDGMVLWNVMKEVHEDSLPDAWVYAVCAKTAHMLAYDGCVTMDDEGRTSVLLTWCRDSSAGLGFVDDALRQGQVCSFSELLMRGYAEWHLGVAQRFVLALRGHVLEHAEEWVASMRDRGVGSEGFGVADALSGWGFTHRDTGWECLDGVCPPVNEADVEQLVSLLEVKNDA